MNKKYERTCCIKCYFTSYSSATDFRDTRQFEQIKLCCGSIGQKMKPELLNCFRFPGYETV